MRYSHPPLPPARATRACAGQTRTRPGHHELLRQVFFGGNKGGKDPRGHPCFGHGKTYDNDAPNHRYARYARYAPCVLYDLYALYALYALYTIYGRYSLC